MRTWLVGFGIAALVACGSGGDDDDDDSGCGDSMCLGAENCDTCEADCGQCPPGCGDGSCNGAETCDSCAPDCGQCSCAPGDGTCGVAEACIDATCQNAYGRIWSITVGDGMMPTTNGAGDAWDALGGAPDPFVEVDLNGTVIGTTSEKADTFTPTWNESVDANIAAGSSLIFWVWDSDVSDNDLMFSCQLDPVTAADLDARQIVCEGAGFNLRASFAP